MQEEQNQGLSPKEERRVYRGKKSLLIKGAIVVLALLLLGGGYYGYLYASTPPHLRNPKFEHYHLRAQVVVDGEPVDFSRGEFQEEYDKTTCSIELTGQPIDFHDGVDQMAHVHWAGMTGGEFLKFYGWNLIDGNDSTLGYRFDQGLLPIHSVDTAGNLLPETPDGAKFYVYVGDEDGYEQKDWNDFLNQDMETFLGKNSLIDTGEGVSFNPLDWISQTAYAHGTETDGHSETKEGETEGERLTRINNLLGNIVIFAQDSEPTDKEIKARFANLVPLSDSVCGG